MRHWERILLILLALGVLALLARTSLAPAAIAADDTDHAERSFDIAVCAMPSLINELMASDRYAPAREHAAPELQDEFGDLREELDDLNKRIQDAPEDDPNRANDMQRRREVFQRLQTLQGRIARAVETKSAEQFAECYNLVRSSANAIAEDLGFDYVISTGDPDEKLNTAISEVTLRQITARPVIRFPEGVDITDDVRDDLHLE